MSWSSWSSRVASSIVMSRTLIALGSSISSVGSFLDLVYVEPSSEVTSLLMSTFLNIGNYIWYPFEVSMYPTNVPFIIEGYSLVLFSFGMCMYTRKPNILRWLTYGFSPEKYYSGVSFSNTQWGLCFCTYTIVLDAFSHRCIEISWSFSIAFVSSIIVMFFHSAMPFYWGL